MADFLNNVSGFFIQIIDNLLNFLFDFLFIIFQLLFGWIKVPPIPIEIKSSINSFLDLIFGNLSLLGFFVRPTTLRIVIPLAIFLFSFKDIYKLTMWIIKKIPFLNIK